MDCPAANPARDLADRANQSQTGQRATPADLGFVWGFNVAVGCDMLVRGAMQKSAQIFGLRC